MAFCIDDGTEQATMDKLSRLAPYPVGYANIKIVDRINYDEGSFTATLNLYVSREAREQDHDRCMHYCIGGPYKTMPKGQDLRDWAYVEVGILLEGLSS